MAATATATEPKPRKLFTVEVGAGGITTKLSKTATDALERAGDVLDCLALAGDTFPKAAAIAEYLAAFIGDPTSKTK